MLEQQLFNALSLGCVYALFALGFTLVFGVLGVINLAHGAVFMVGAYAALYSVVAGAAAVGGAGARAFVSAGLLGLVIDVLVLSRCARASAPHLIPMIATIGLAIADQQPRAGHLRRREPALPVGSAAAGRARRSPDCT